MALTKVLQIARLKKSCRRCEKMVQEPAPSRPIPGSMASAALLAYILVSKFDDHLRLYHPAEIFARMGADIDPDDPTYCEDWRIMGDGSVNEVIGQYHYAVTWEDGTADRGRLNISTNEFEAIIVLTTVGPRYH